MSDDARPAAVTADYADDYEELRDLIIDLLNPPDGDDGELLILSNAVSGVVRYVERQPCTCPPGAADFDDDPCDRCQVLGRNGNNRIPR